MSFLLVLGLKEKKKANPITITKAKDGYTSHDQKAVKLSMRTKKKAKQKKENRRLYKDSYLYLSM